MRCSSAMRARAMALVVLIVASSALILSGCKGTNDPNTESVGAILSTGTVQAEMPALETSSATEATTNSNFPSSESTSVTGGGKLEVGATPANPGTKEGPTVWLARVGSLAKAVKYPVWFPKTVTKGFKLDSTDIVEMDKGTGLVCDIVYLNGDKVLQFTQGSPKERSYEIESEGKVPWGTETADVVRLDPEDPASPVAIIYYKRGNFAELQGDVTLAELKAVAASMVLVK